ncbi:dye-decolorizing peroxidase YfeX [Aplysia californica]|uniref:Dye-decolorizing peroxidase YfeX n=1 Tax=Aplysia californica TaxID=6500 RepID=A0ABM0JQ08_APLCA|nr:dye-decolorizing peroxidase YfeX [Aplysia californica]
MASFRTLSAVRSSVIAKGLVRPLSTRASTSSRSKGALLLGTATAGLIGYGAYRKWDVFTAKDDAAKAVMSVVNSSAVTAAGPPQAQPSVFSPGKNHALYLWIHLKPEANSKEVARACAKLQKLVDAVVDPAMKDEDDEILAGVGFGPNFYAQVTGRKAPKNFTYPYRKGALGDMPSSGGEIFIHAKSNETSKLFELCQLFIRSLPKDSVDKFEDIYSFVYQNGRDLSGFIDGTENRADDEGRQEVAVEKETGGSYVITQKWIHNLDVISTEKTKTLESWVGRDKSDSTELSRKSISSHVARMTSGNGFQSPKPVEIVRQSMPFGTISGEAGLFFIGYAANPINFEYMLDRMVGSGGDGHSDDIMRLSKNVKGNYWYFPGAQDLAKLA